MVPSWHANIDSLHFVCLGPGKIATVTEQKQITCYIVRKLVKSTFLNGFIRHPGLHRCPSPWTFNETNGYLSSTALKSIDDATQLSVPSSGHTKFCHTESRLQNIRSALPGLVGCKDVESISSWWIPAPWNRQPAPEISHFLSSSHFVHFGEFHLKVQLTQSKTTINTSV